MIFNRTNGIKNMNIDKASVQAQKEERLKNMTNDEKIDMFAGNAAKLLAKKAEMEVPENGKFSRVLISFDVPGTQNVAYYYIEHDELDPKDTRRFTISTARKGSDRLTNANIFKGTKAQMLEYLNDSKNAQLFRDTLRDVSKSTDDYYSSF